MEAEAIGVEAEAVEKSPLTHPCSLGSTTILLYRCLTSYRLVAAKIYFSSFFVTDNDFTNVAFI